MANCPNCNAPLEDDARFCANCGAAIPEEAPAPAPQTPDPEPETIFCPNCGGRTNAAFEYCEHCGAALNAPGGGQKTNKAGIAGMKKWLILGGGVVALAAIVIVLISIFSGGGGKAGGLYLKEKELHYSKLSPKGAWQVSSELIEGANNSTLSSARGYISALTVMSSDGKMLFFPDKIDSGYTLFCRSTASENKKAVKVDSDINYYYVNKNASLVTYLKGGNVYQYNVGRDKKEKLVGDVAAFQASEDGKKIVYIDDENVLYLFTVSGKKEEKVDSDVSDFIVSKDYKTVVYKKDDTLYLKRAGKDRDKIASDVYTMVYAYDNGAVYYTERDDDEVTLYYFDGKDSKEVTKDYAWDSGLSTETPVLVFRDVDEDYWIAVGDKTSELDVEKPSNIVVSDDGKSIWYIDDPDDGEGDLYQVAISGGTAKDPKQVDEDVYTSYIGYNESGHLYYFKDVKNGEGELYIDGKKADDDVRTSSLSWSESGAVKYYTDYNANKSYGTLKQYSGGKSTQIDDDVYESFYLPNGNILYLKDYNTGKSKGDLYVYRGGKPVQLDEDVVAIVPISSEQYGYSAYY